MHARVEHTECTIVRTSSLLNVPVSGTVVCSSVCQENAWWTADTAETARHCAGVVTLDVQGQIVRLRDWEGEDITSDVPGSGEEVMRIELLDPETKQVVRAYGRNDLGGFFQTFMLNKWRQRIAQGLLCVPR